MFYCNFICYLCIINNSGPAVYRMVSVWRRQNWNRFCVVLFFRISLITWRNTPAGESTSWRDTLSLLKSEPRSSWTTPNRSGTNITCMCVTCGSPVCHFYITCRSPLHYFNTTATHEQEWILHHSVTLEKSQHVFNSTCLFLHVSLSLPVCLQEPF